MLHSVELEAAQSPKSRGGKLCCYATVCNLRVLVKGRTSTC